MSDVLVGVVETETFDNFTTSLNNGLLRPLPTERVIDKRVVPVPKERLTLVETFRTTETSPNLNNDLL